MNTGITRYAKALLRYVEQTGGGERVCSQVRSLLADPEVESVALEPELERFVWLLRKHGRLDNVRFILSTFVSMYYNSLGESCVKLISAVPLTDGLEDWICSVLEHKLGRKLHCEREVDPSILGGFVLIVDNNYIYDASARHQLDSIRRQFVKNNTRIV